MPRLKTEKRARLRQALKDLREGAGLERSELAAKLESGRKVIEHIEEGRGPQTWPELFERWVAECGGMIDLSTRRPRDPLYPRLMGRQRAILDRLMRLMMTRSQEDLLTYLEQTIDVLERAFPADDWSPDASLIEEPVESTEDASTPH